MSEEKTIWGIHMGLVHGTQPITDSYIAIGWREMGDLSKLPGDRDAFKKAVASTYPQLKAGAVPVVAGTLFRFSNEMKSGDLVIYPSKIDRMVNLGTIDSGYKFQSNAEGYPNSRRVKWLKHLPRAVFSQNALHEIGSAVTLFQVKNNSDEFMAAFEGKPFESADVDEQTVEATVSNTEETTADFVVKRLKDYLSPYQFEHFISHLLERMGYYTRVTQQSGDGGVDIIAHKDKLGFEPPIIKVQCKQSLSNSGQPDVAQLYGHVESREHGLFVTLGGYTAQARQFERSKHNLRLIDGEELVSLIFDHYDQFEPRYQALLPLKKTYVPAAVAGDG